MSTTYDYQQDQWDKARDEMRSILVAKARGRGMIPYSTLVAQVQTIELEPDSFALAAMLGEISAAEDAAGRGMLSVIVVHKDGDMRPGPGFFDLAETLGRNTADIDKTWLQELDRVHAYWDKH